jgi:hypothetical protein|tara:strand:- start:86 stop:931 length:846 start_codon:yes stop_codon:yes gene_type:complete
MEETMPEETENLEKEIEIPNEEETEEIEVEASAEASGEHEEEIDKYSDKVQKRIDKLTYNQREAERQRDEALRVAQTLQGKVREYEAKAEENSQALFKEYNGRVNSELEKAKDDYRKAVEGGDVDTQVSLQQDIAKLAVEQETLSRREQPKTRIEKSNGADVPPPVDPRATAWAQKEENSWFGRDRVMTSAAFEIDKEMQEQGINPTAADYYQQLDGRIKEAFPHKFEQEEVKAPPVQAVGRTSAGANPNTRKSRKVKLTTSQQAIAKKLGVPLEEYAKYV